MYDPKDLFDDLGMSPQSQGSSSSRRRIRTLSTSWSKTEASKLVFLIKVEERLWNTFHPDYKDLKGARPVWEKIAKQMERKSDDCVNKWGSLRSNFKARYVDKTNSEDEEPTPEDMPEPYCHMDFLKDVIRKKVALRVSSIANKATHAVELKAEDNYRVTMDCAGLIRQIALNPALWNKKSEGHNNRTVTDKIWDGIAIKLKATKEKCKKKWKYLKDEYRKALRKVPQTASGAESEPYVSKFKYFNMMAFLKDGMNSQGDFEYIECPFDSVSHDESSNMSLTSNADTMERGKKRTDEVYDAYAQIENKKLKLLEKVIEEDKDCGDLHFFKSLLPFVKDLPRLEKLRMRGEIHAVVLKYFESEQHNMNQSARTPKGPIYGSNF